MNTNDRLDRLEKVVTLTAERQDRLTHEFGELRQEFGGLQQQFGGLRQEFGELRQEFRELRQDHADGRAYVDLKHEEILSHFRAFREMYQHLSQRVEVLESKAR